MKSRNWMETLTMMMIGDAVLSILFPKKHLQLWRVGPFANSKTVDFFVEHPGLTQLISAIEIALALWLASRQEPQTQT